MKNFILITLFLFAFKTWGQIEKGTFQAGIGGLPIVYFDNTAPTGYSLKANVGFFPTNKLAIGFMPFIGKVDDMKSRGVSFYSRYYFQDKKLVIFLEGSAGLGRLSYEDTPEFDGTMSTVSIGPGFGYRLNNRLMFEFIPQFARLRNESHPESTYVGNTFIPTIGLQFFFK